MPRSRKNRDTSSAFGRRHTGHFLNQKPRMKSLWHPGYAASNFIALIFSCSIRQMFFLELNSKKLYRSSTEEKESRCLVFTSSTKREIRLFHVAVVQWRQKSVMHMQSCCFSNLNLLLFCRSRWRRRHRCLSSLFFRDLGAYSGRRSLTFCRKCGAH